MAEGTEAEAIIVAPYDNKEAWLTADLICDGINDEVEIQAAIQSAAQLGKPVRFEPGVFKISDAIVGLGYPKVILFCRITTLVRDLWRGLFGHS